MLKVFIRQTAYGAFNWQLHNVKTSEVLAQSKDFEKRADAIAAANDHIEQWIEGIKNLTDQTYEGKREAKNGKA